MNEPEAQGESTPSRECGDEPICDSFRGTAADERLRQKLIYTNFLTLSKNWHNPIYQPPDCTLQKYRILVFGCEYR